MILFDILYNFIFSFIASCSFGFLCQIPKKTVVAGGIVGASGWLGYYFLNQIGSGVFIASFCCSLILSVLSYTYSYARKYPSTVFFIPGLVPVVPGITFYEVFKNVFMGNYEAAEASFGAVVSSAVALACGITIGNILFLTVKRIFKNSKSTRKIKL